MTEDQKTSESVKNESGSDKNQKSEDVENERAGDPSQKSGKAPTEGAEATKKTESKEDVSKKKNRKGNFFKEENFFINSNNSKLPFFLDAAHLRKMRREELLKKSRQVGSGKYIF